MLIKDDLEALAQTRLDDAVLLLQSGRPSSAYYLAGYAVELALKACIAKAFQPNVIPDKAFVNEIYVHRLEKLLGTAGLDRHSAQTLMLIRNWLLLGVLRVNGRNLVDTRYGIAFPPAI